MIGAGTDNLHMPNDVEHVGNIPARSASPESNFKDISYRLELRHPTKQLFCNLLNAQGHGRQRKCVSSSRLTKQIPVRQDPRSNLGQKEDTGKDTRSN